MYRRSQGMSFYLSTFLLSFSNVHIDSCPFRNQLHLFDSVHLLPSEEIRLILTHKIDRVEQDKDHQFSKDLHFKVLDSIQVMLDLAPCQILEIVFPILEADQSQDLFPDLDLEISISQLNVIIVIAWVTQQIIVLDNRIEILHADNQIKVEEIVTEILKGIQTTDRILDIEHLILHNIE